VHAPTEAFEKARFSKSKGVLEFANKLNHHAGRMIERPSQYTVKRKFFNGLPHEMVRTLLLDKGLSGCHYESHYAYSCNTWRVLVVRVTDFA
jgi:hypothetical protein